MSDLSPSTPDTLLIERCVAGGRDAWELLYRRYQPWLLGCLYQKLWYGRRRLETAEEIASGIWLELLVDGCRRLRAYDPGRAPLRVFLAALARLHLRRHFSRCRAPVPVELPVGDETLVEASDLFLESGLVWDDLRSVLSPLERAFLPRLLHARDAVPAAGTGHGRRLTAHIRAKLGRLLAG
jgi:hypothetical protein